VQWGILKEVQRVLVPLLVCGRDFQNVLAEIDDDDQQQQRAGITVTNPYKYKTLKQL
jgi:hypothetical protein